VAHQAPGKEIAVAIAYFQLLLLLAVVVVEPTAGLLALLAGLVAAVEMEITSLVQVEQAILRL